MKKMLAAKCDNGCQPKLTDFARKNKEVIKTTF